MSAARLLNEILSLPPEERRALMRQVLASLSDATPDAPESASIEEAWYAEIQDRRRRLDAGEMTLIPWEEVRAELLADER
ncbi:addiction module protein [Nannocystis radixulma]|uniref:Addiction module protein n=1 Tax=Nannocystis radixulma TaxID=2995305 RepID=A0ABT5BKR9_9BACT|nr:addiction module protein [Nannocystis radixulma]MDC0674739.1 addiction module protein [Nannocystis radixulma]